MGYFFVGSNPGSYQSGADRRFNRVPLPVRKKICRHNISISDSQATGIQKIYDVAEVQSESFNKDILCSDRGIRRLGTEDRRWPTNDISQPKEMINLIKNVVS
jgi:hypothetical protein